MSQVNVYPMQQDGVPLEQNGVHSPPEEPEEELEEEELDEELDEELLELEEEVVMQVMRVAGLQSPDKSQHSVCLGLPRHLGILRRGSLQTGDKPLQQNTVELPLEQNTQIPLEELEEDELLEEEELEEELDDELLDELALLSQIP